jgi:hypothetical protein
VSPTRDRDNGVPAGVTTAATTSGAAAHTLIAQLSPYPSPTATAIGPSARATAS